MKEDRATALALHREINRDLTISLAKAAISANLRRFIFLSTVKVMRDDASSEMIRSGNLTTGKVITENDEPHPNDPYGISKYEAEQGLEKLFRQQKHSRCVAVRLPMIYGPGNKGNALRMLKCAERGIPLPLRAVRAKRSMIYVKNLCDALVAIIKDDKDEPSPFQSFYVTDGEDRSSAELYEGMFRAFNSKNGVFYIPPLIFRLAQYSNHRLGSIISRLIDPYCFSSKAFQNKYNWNAPYTFEQGILETARWYETRHLELCKMADTKTSPIGLP
jgi:UDP-glucose 4-epimerase